VNEHAKQSDVGGAPAEDRGVYAFPASFAQQRLWFVDQLEPGNPVYNLPYHQHTRLRGDLDAAALEAAIGMLVQRHEPLRTTFATVDGEPVQIIHDEVDTSLPVIDLSELEPSARDAELDRVVATEARHAFDLERGPLFYTKLVRLAPDDHLVIQMMSHIVADGMSLQMVAAELGELYAARLDDREPDLPELPLQYADFVVWHREWIDSEGPRRQLDYWRDRLGGQLPVIELPSDRPRQAVQRNRGSWLPFDLDPELTVALHELSRREGASLFMTLLTGFKVMLHRYSRQDEILVGSPTANRSQPELEPLVAFFVNPVVLRSDLSGDPSFAEFLQQVRATALGAFGHQDVPFERLVEELRPPRDLSHHPLFQVSFTLQMPPSLLELEGTRSEPYAFDNGTSKFDLLAELWESDGGVAGHIEYDTDQFDRATIVRMMDSYRAVLRAAVADPSSPVSKLALLGDATTEQMLRQWNDTSRPYDRAATVHSLIEASVAARPDSVAVQCGGQQLTYAQLDLAANRLARRLVAAGVRPGHLVGVNVDRSVDMIVGLLAVMKSGAAYLPLDPDYPSERLRFVLDDARAEVLVTQCHLRSRWDDFNGAVLSIDDDDDQNLDTVEPLDVEVAADDLVYTIHTSGSTGRPKGVQLKHRNVVNFLTSMAAAPGLGPDDVLLAVTTLSFDIAVLELYLPLVVGAKVVIADAETQLDGRLMAQTIRDEGVTMMQATPATWKLLLASGWEGTPGLRILCGGEEMPRDLAERLLPCAREVWNMYGPTETTVWSAARRVESGDGPVPIGDPIANTQLYVLDDLLQPVPIGVPGELCIGGDGVAFGYLDRADLTAERFVPDPFARNPDARLYRTGDLSRYRADGTIEFLGRIDLQVKVRGFRIELGEVEAVLERAAGVREVVVTAQPDPGGDSRLVAYVVATDGGDVDAGKLQDHVGQALPAYMIPTLFVPMSQWPLTDNGKIDRRGLPAPSDVDLGRSTEHVAPRDDIESEIAQIWSELVGVSVVGVDDNFFELGGHSLLATQVLARVDRALGVTIPVAVLFGSPTVAALSEHVATTRLLEAAPLDDGGEREEFVL
jgi:amino acid adenylation domain-containing protein